jgi:hypothetical protein
MMADDFVSKRFFGGWWLWVLFLLVISIITFFGLRMAGVIGERIVFENSFQYSESVKAEIATFEAQLAEIDRQLSNSELDKQTRENLEAQAAGIRIKLSTARSKQ